MTLFYYMEPFNSLTNLVAVLGEWTIFVIVAYQIAKRTSVVFQIILTPILGGFAMLTWDYLFLKFAIHYHFISGVL